MAPGRPRAAPGPPLQDMVRRMVPVSPDHRAELPTPAPVARTVSRQATRRRSVRQALAGRTREAHERLHVHPWIASLASSTLTVERYRLVLGAYRAYFEHVESERARLGLLPGLSLRGASRALASDLAALDGDRHPRVRPDGPRFEDAPSLLGALYVLHGSGFGGRVLGARVRATLPEAPRAYLVGGTPPALWRRLEDELERLRDDEVARERLVRSAADTFDAFGRFVSRFCEHGREPLGAER